MTDVEHNRISRARDILVAVAEAAEGRYVESGGGVASMSAVWETETYDDIRPCLVSMNARDSGRDWQMSRSVRLYTFHAPIEILNANASTKDYVNLMSAWIVRTLAVREEMTRPGRELLMLPCDCPGCRKLRRSIRRKGGEA